MVRQSAERWAEDAAAAAVAAAGAAVEVESCGRIKRALDNLLDAEGSLAGAGGERARLEHEELHLDAVRDHDGTQELMENLAMPLLRYTTAAFYINNLRGALVAACRLSSGGGNRVTDVRRELKSEATRAMLLAQASRSAAESAVELRAAVPATRVMREVVGQLHEVGALRFFDEVEARFHETQAEEAAAEENYKDRQPAADARREAKREWLRMAGAQVTIMY